MNRIVRMVLMNLPVVPGLWFKLCYNAKHTDTVPEIDRWNLIQHILNRAIKGGNVDLTVTGLENIPAEGGFMMYANHQGMFDVLAIAGTCPAPLGAVLKKELYNVPFLHQIALCTKSYAMDREDVRQSLTVSKLGNEMLEFHGGSFRCATKSRCTVLPVALIDSFKVLDQKGSGPVSMELHYLKPIPYGEYENLKPAELAALVKQRIAEKIAERTQGGSVWSD